LDPRHELEGDTMAIYVEEVEHDVPEEEHDAEVLTRAETAECTCPDFCERDHDNE
jgi:hypothetical protein